MLQDAEKKKGGEGSQSCYNIKGVGAGVEGEGQRRGKEGKAKADPQLAPVSVHPRMRERGGSPKQQWPLHNGPLMGRSSGMDCIRGGA